MQEKSACGVGFIVSRDGKSKHDIVQQGLRALRRVEHRGASAADGLTGDGAGIMTDIPFDLFGCQRGYVAVATLFISTQNSEEKRWLLNIFEETFAFWGMKILEYRELPTNPKVLGPLALETMPTLLHAVIRRPAHCNTDASFDKNLHVAKQMTLTRQRQRIPNPPFFFTSLSANTIVYKALTTSALLDQFYLDLQNPAFKSRFALFHRRFSTNTVSSWDKAQPFRLIAHNGEINTIAGNRSWAYSCEKSIGLPPNELITHEGISDSGSVNEMVEALMYRSSLPHIEDCLALMMPPADSKNSFYKFWGRSMEPWDGPALMAFADGETVGARLDRNGFRPCRWVYTNDYFYLASEAGAFDVPEEEVIEKGALRAGKCLKIDLITGQIDFRDPSESRANRGAQFEHRLIPLGYAAPSSESYDPVKKFVFNLTEEEQSKILFPMILEGKEPIGSMGDTARLAVLSSEPRPFFDYFHQNFAQVTNPPLDYLRERMVTDLAVYLGRRPNLFAKKELIPPRPAFELPSPVLSLGQLEYLETLAASSEASPLIRVRRFDMTFDRQFGVVDLEGQLAKMAEQVVQAVKAGTFVVVLSDSNANFDRLPIPALIALRAVIRALNVAGLRLKVSIVIDSGQIRTTHQLSAMIGFGASAVCPRLALEIARGEPRENFTAVPAEQREKNLIKAFESGLLKVMSKMGISVVRSYQGSKLFTIMGLSGALCRKYFKDVPTLMGGLELDDIVGDLLKQADAAKQAASTAKLVNTYQLREHPQGLVGEKHSMTSSRARAIHKLAREKNLSLDSMELFDEYLRRGFDDQPVNVRHLLELKAASSGALSVSEVEAIDGILKRFGSGAMSFGAISAEAQRDIILAMQEIGGRSNSGEGGENPYYHSHGIAASTKQIASARFGVTAQYLVSSQEFQIKMAQGAKPGEGGQLMAPKVNEDIARARHSMTHVDLISPPPMHDIYSIEDLKQLIYELKQLKPDAKVGVKLVSGANIGTIALGVAKAGADIIQISGNDGGTGAAPVSSMKHAGLPFEFGLLEVHKALTENGLRDKVILRADGGLHSGKDIVMAALMGAQEYDFGKLLLVAEGCIMARICEKNTCPAGIATHDPKFKARYTGNKDQIVTVLKFIAQDVRRQLALIGAKSLDEVIGRTDLLELNARHVDLVKKRKLNLSFALRPALPLNLVKVENAAGEDKAVTDMSGVAGVNELNARIMRDCVKLIEDNQSAELDYDIKNSDRAIPATLSGALAKLRHSAHVARFGSGAHAPGLTNVMGSVSVAGPATVPGRIFNEKIRFTFRGSAGQGFGVFLVDGLEMRLLGEANDSVCKTMSGGKVVIRPPKKAQFQAHENVIVGNCALYGATGGTLYVSGLAGDRFAVRNSGALAIVEGAGLHACEYMTNGTVVILGPCADNIGSGMTGGALFLYEDHSQKINTEFLAQCALSPADELALRTMLQDYLLETDSIPARKILAHWDESKVRFKKYLPKNILAQQAAEATATPMASAKILEAKSCAKEISTLS